MARPKKVPAKKAPPPPPAPLVVVTSTAFDRDLVLAKKRGWDLGRLETVTETLRERRQLARKHRDHALKGEWRGYRDCHVADDWLLIYRVVADELQLVRTGTHQDLFE